MSLSIISPPSVSTSILKYFFKKWERTGSIPVLPTLLPQVKPSKSVVVELGQFFALGHH